MKKGFTMIEVILSISLILAIGVIGFFSIKFINKNTKESKLENMRDTILTATRLYIETNPEVKEQLYSDKNGVVVPLRALETAGLVNFQDIDYDEQKDYVLTLLGSSDSENACVDTTTIGSWEDGNKTIFLCTDKKGNSSLSSIGFSGNNLSLTGKSRVWFYTNYMGSNYGVEADAEAKANNYVKYGDNVYKIYYIDRDDSLVLLSHESFGNVFNGKTQNIEYEERNIECNNSNKSYVQIYRRNGCSSSTGYVNGNGYFCDTIKEQKITKNEANLTFMEMFNSNIIYDKYITHLNVPANTPTNYCSINNTIYDYLRTQTSVFGFKDIANFNGDNYSQTAVYFKNNNTMFKIHLKPCMKINGGSGDTINPYNLVDYC